MSGPWGDDEGNSQAGQADPHLVSEDHEAVVGLAPDGPAHTLGRVAHGVEGEEVVLSDLELVPQVFQPRLRRDGARSLTPVPLQQPLPRANPGGAPKGALASCAPRRCSP